MIRYSLLCERDHAFDSWFEGSSAFDRLAGAGLVECPVCGSNLVRKAVMAPHVARSDATPTPPSPEPAAPAEAPSGTLMTKGTDARLAELQQEALRIARAIRDHVRESADYVGPRFAEEARRIHFGEVQPHGIYGEASAKDVQDLAEEGIDIHPLPRLPEDGN